MERRTLTLALLASGLLAACQTPPVAAPTIVLPDLPPEPAPPPPKPPRIGLALGGGAARGFAHIGVIQALEEHRIQPDLVVGTSAGSLVAALYASGMSGAAMAELARTMDASEITDWAFPGGVLSAATRSRSSCASRPKGA